VTTPEIIYQIHKLILEDNWILAKSITKQLGISREWVGSIIHEDLDMQKLSAKWVLICLNADHKRQQSQSSEECVEFFQSDPNDFLSPLVTMYKTWLYALRSKSSRTKSRKTKKRRRVIFFMFIYSK